MGSTKSSGFDWKNRKQVKHVVDSERLKAEQEALDVHLRVRNY